MLKSDVIKHFTTAKAVADALRMTESAVSQWGEKIPMGRQYQLEVITNGALKVDPESLPKKAA